MILPSLRIVEEFGTVDIAHDMVDIIFIDDDLGVSAFDELLAEFFQRGIDLYRRISVRGTIQSRTLVSEKSRAFWNIFTSSLISSSLVALSMLDCTR